MRFDDIGNFDEFDEFTKKKLNEKLVLIGALDSFVSTNQEK